MNSKLKPYLQPSFLICVVVLAFAAGFKEAIIEKTGVHFIKLELPLKKSLDDMDETKLGPYKVVQKSKIENKDILESLGTENYIQWVLEDTEVDASSPQPQPCTDPTRVNPDHQGHSQQRQPSEEPRVTVAAQPV